MQKIGRYEILDELGRGAMGVVYRARDTQIGRVVALKVILTANASPQDIERYKQRFRREAQAAGRLSHPGIVTIHDIAEDEAGQPYLVMEYIEGRPLNLLLGPTAQVPLDRLLDIGIQVAEALDYAHKSGIVHRDIKPPNILVTSEGRAKIADFGIARMEGTELTQEGTSVGTPSYMSPEQFRGGEIDGRSDIFSLGAVLYWMVTGEKPFAGETVTRISFQVAFEAPTPPSVARPGLPQGLDEVLSRCMAKAPAGRYASAAELAADLAAIRAGKPLPARLAPPADRTGPYPLPQRELERGAGASVGESDPNALTHVAARRRGTRTQPLHSSAPKRFPPGLILLGGAMVAAGLVWGYWKLGLGAVKRIEPVNVAAPTAPAAAPAAAPRAAAVTETTSPAAAAPRTDAEAVSPANQNGAVNDGADAATPPLPATGTAPESHALKKSEAQPAPRKRVESTPSAKNSAAAPESAPGARNAPAAESPASAAATSPPGENPEKPLAADATLEIECNYPFKEATLEIFVDGKPLFTGALEAKRRKMTLGITRGGKLEAKRDVPSGRHAIRVHVKSDEDKFEDEATVTETIAPHAVRTLKISFGEEGSGPGGGRKVRAELQ